MSKGITKELTDEELLEQYRSKIGVMDTSYDESNQYSVESDEQLNQPSLLDDARNTISDVVEEGTDFAKDLATGVSNIINPDAFGMIAGLTFDAVAIPTDPSDVVFTPMALAGGGAAISEAVRRASSTIKKALDYSPEALRRDEQERIAFEQTGQQLPSERYGGIIESGGNIASDILVPYSIGKILNGLGLTFSKAANSEFVSKKTKAIGKKAAESMSDTNKGDQKILKQIVKDNNLEENIDMYGNSWIRKFGDTIAKYFPESNTLIKSKLRSLERLDYMKDDIANNIAEIRKPTANMAPAEAIAKESQDIMKGKEGYAKKYRKKNVSSKFDALNNSLTEVAGPLNKIRVTPSNLSTKIAQIQSKLPEYEKLGIQTDMLKRGIALLEVEAGGIGRAEMSYSSLDQFRKDIGERIDAREYGYDFYKDLYQTVSDDLDDVLIRYQSKAIKNGNNLVSMKKAANDAHIEYLDKMESIKSITEVKLPEMIKGLEKSAEGGIKELVTFRDSIKQEDPDLWKEIKSLMFTRMGKPNAQGIIETPTNLDEALKTFNMLDSNGTNAAKELFEESYQPIKDYMAVAARLNVVQKQMNSRGITSSGFYRRMAITNQAMGLMGVSGVSILKAPILHTATNKIGAAMTNPKFINYLKEGTEIDLKYLKEKQDLGGKTPPSDFYKKWKKVASNFNKKAVSLWQQNVTLRPFIEESMYQLDDKALQDRIDQQREAERNTPSSL